MTNDELLEYAASRGHEVFAFQSDRFEAVTEEIDDTYAIGIDPRLTEDEQLARLAHELGHCETNGLYTRYSPLIIKEQYEYRADKWAFHKLLPIRLLRMYAKKGVTESWEIAEALNLPDWFVKKALGFYGIFGET